ncbi:ATP-binding protein [Actinoplanes sp. NPDC049265]|uniref:ATP-binding protein n=1 Tax=Actinoplanes sp. NPDC049265 TaxID=3363902 RepID=UPI00371D62D1
MFGHALRTARRRCGLTQEELAAHSGVSVRNIRDLETGRIARPRPATVRRLADALGLSGDDRTAFLTAAGGLGDEPQPVRLRPRPAQLPADTAVFVGRDTELAQLDDSDTTSPLPVVWTVTGPAGVGKTCFAVHWAHRAVDQFPDGQLYVNLRGYGPGEMVPTSEAVRGFLDAFGVPPNSVPTDPSAQLSLFRSVLAGKQILILLDNARDAAQVRPLLPGTAGCVVVVTSRNPLHGLVATAGARPVRLEMLSTADAAGLLTRRVGADRLDGDTDAVRAIIDRCQRLPLALAVVAGRLVSEPMLTAARVAGDLTAGMSAFASDDEHTDLRSVFSWSYRILSPAAARLFRLLSLNPGPDWSAIAAEALTGGPATELLAELLRTQLLSERTPGRYTMHDLLRAYAAEQCARTDDPVEIRAAQARLLDAHLLWSSAAAQTLEPHREPVDERPPPLFGDDDEMATSWLTTERANLLALVKMAADQGFPGLCWRLAWQLTTFIQRRGNWYDLLRAHEIALDTAHRAGDLRGESHAHRGLSRALFRLERFDEARGHLDIALEQATRLGDVLGQARTLHGLAYAAQRQARFTEAFARLTESRGLFEDAGSTEGVASSLNSQAWCLTLVGQAAEARAAAEQAVELYARVANRHGQATSLDTLGRAYAGLGDHRQAVSYYEQARQVFRGLGDRYSEAETLRHLADAHEQAGDAAAARSARRRSDSILARVDRPRSRAS